MKFAIFTFFSFISSFVFANNLQLQQVSLTDTNRTAKTVNIKMNISWEHSWRDSINWDAAWIIVKYKEPKDSMWKWKHAQLSKSGNDFGTGTAAMKIVVPDDRTGGFFYRSSLGSGNVASENVKLFWNYGAAGVTNIDSVEIRVFATEMVYVPEGNYCLGDGNGTQRSPNSFQLKNSPNNYAVISNKWTPLINTDNNYYYSALDDDAIVWKDGFRISGMDGLDLNNDKVADNPDYPTGYRAFYAMKYKVTQGQYTDFLNTMSVNDTTATALENYVSNGIENFEHRLKSAPKELQAAWGILGPFDDPGVEMRNTIAFDSNQTKFIVSRPDRAYGRMNLDRGLSFSEWFGLRPMSELEFEKASRGPVAPLTGEAAWGDDSQFPNATGIFGNYLTFSGFENGTEFFKDYDITKRYYSTNLAGGDGGEGPYRVGIFSTDTSSRISSGASYYGLMDLSKITMEIVFPLSTAQTRLFSHSIHGKGILSAFGRSYSFANARGTGLYPPSIYRYSVISFRGNTNNSSIGFHAVRLAPSDN